jgi:hypothetical protein
MTNVDPTSWTMTSPSQIQHWTWCNRCGASYLTGQVHFCAATTAPYTVLASPNPDTATRLDFAPAKTRRGRVLLKFLDLLDRVL